MREDSPLERLHAALRTLAAAELPGWEPLATRAATRVRSAGELLFDAGETPGQLFWVDAGYVVLEVSTAGGRTRTKSIVEGGELLGSVEVLRGEPSSYRARCLTRVVVTALPLAAVLALTRERLEWARALSARLTEVAQQRERRERELLLLTPEERWDALQRTRPALVAAVAQVELAPLVGVTPVALSRLKRRAREARAAR
ncbi:Crp/Fnr family transcriptional regulator [Protaetiibacter larvae]|uniref:Crp/Fnr family transcriptional regulator n=1 Tax=Protaetiibacter larvae TaxID=2592654 RepID=UPI00143DD162|nr:cyclic nucleotide-binding domain-containing protein [Protaetiibacter larvae]